MDEKVVPVFEGLTWEPNAPDAVLIQNDWGTACLGLNAHFSDTDTRAVVMVWSGCHRAVMGSPNDEAVHVHRLADAGLRTVRWAGEVKNSAWVEELALLAHQPPTRHFIVLTKERVVEVVADSMSVKRIPGPTIHAARQALGQSHT
jgi:hypothetical protein